MFFGDLPSVFDKRVEDFNKKGICMPCIYWFKDSDSYYCLKGGHIYGEKILRL